MTENRLIFYMQGIGNCAQGFVDAVLFVAFTPEIRKKFIVCKGKKKPKKHSLLYAESKNIYDNALKNYSPRYNSSCSSTPLPIESTRISPTPEPSTSFQESPTADMPYSIQNKHEYNYIIYS